jgi:hypothetical protein
MGDRSFFGFFASVVTGKCGWGKVVFGFGRRW